MVKCGKCGADIPDDSAYCPFCGNEISNVITNTKSKQSNVLCIVLGVLCVALIGIGIWGYYHMNILYTEKISQVTLEKDAQIDELKRMLDEKDEKYNNSASKYENTIASLENAIVFPDLEQQLQSAGIANSVMSTDRFAYAIRRGQTTKINVNWKKNGATAFARCNDNKVAIKWNDENDLIVTGKERGSTTITFSTDDKYKSKDSFDIVIICY